MEVLDKEDEGHTPEESAEESSEYEEYTGTVMIVEQIYLLLNSRIGFRGTLLCQLIHYLMRFVFRICWSIWNNIMFCL